MPTDPRLAATLDALFGNSPYLTEIALEDPGFMSLLWRDDPDRTVADILAAIPAAGVDVDAVAAACRRAKRKLALAIGLADIAGQWPLEQVTGTLSAFADRAVGRILDSILLQAEARGQLRLNGDPAAAAMTVLGMGKLGAGELNYSSDIDLIVLYDREAPAIAEDDAIGAKLVRVVRSLVQALSERTAEGYVFRTDLRLRPDPGSTPLAISVQAAETYYESVGQNWERAAMIKARPVAGNIAVGERFLDGLRPYIWRKHLDFAAIADIHSIKRQIDAHRGTGTVKVAGHNVKLGRGGIREIEFFGQTQQLIFGGRHPGLRLRGTIEGLHALVEHGMLAANVAADLSTAYRYLRRVEHRLQMVDDHQTHTLPTSDEGLEAVATFLGYPDVGGFHHELLDTLRLVESHYARLFEESPGLGAAGGNLVFTGTDRDPGTLATLRDLGYGEPERAWDVVSQWHHGRYRSTHTVRARELLTELKPALLKALASGADPDQALLRFDALLRAQPAGVQLFSLFKANPSLLDLVATIMGSAPRVAGHLAPNPVLLDGVLTAGFFDAFPDRAVLAADLDIALRHCTDEQELLDAARRWTNDQRFRIGVKQLAGPLAPDAAGHAYGDVAEVALAAISDRVQTMFETQHGGFGGRRLAVVALGKLGSREMTATSDLDLIFVYDVPTGLEASDGERPLAPAHYFARLGQKILTAVTVPTNEGVLYEVDMRLRPSGNKGPLATSLAAFEAYQRDAAWTWEHMALIRGRVVAGPAELADKVSRAIHAALSRPRQPERLLRDVADMRARIAEHRPPRNGWDVKLIRGGLFDIDFVVQYLQLRGAHDRPAVLARAPRDAIEALRRAGDLSAPQAIALGDALRLWTAVQGLLRLALDDPEQAFDEDAAPEGLRRLLAHAAGVDTFAALRERMKSAAESAYQAYLDIVERPAASLPPAPQEAT